MSLEKAIRYGKERRRVYRKSAAFDRSCRHHGSCPWCRANRLYSRIKAETAARQQEDELLTDWLNIAAASFTFWDNEADRMYDDYDGERRRQHMEVTDEKTSE